MNSADAYVNILIHDLSVALLHQVLSTPRADGPGQIKVLLKNNNPEITKSPSNPWKISFLFVLFSPCVIFRINLHKFPGESADFLIVVYVSINIWKSALGAKPFLQPSSYRSCPKYPLAGCFTFICLAKNKVTLLINDNRRLTKIIKVALRRFEELMNSGSYFLYFVRACTRLASFTWCTIISGVIQLVLVASISGFLITPRCRQIWIWKLFPRRSRPV